MAMASARGPAEAATTGGFLDKTGAAAKTPRGTGPSVLGLSHVQKSPNWSFAGKPASDLEIKDLPGPGAYAMPPTDQTSRYSKASHFSFGTSAREVLTKQKIPGPGAYMPPSDFDKRGKSGWTMPDRKKEKPSTTKDNPAPGKYDISTKFGEGPKFTAAVKQKDNKVPEQPGPGDYDAVASEATGDRQPRCCFGKYGMTAPAGSTAANLSGQTPGPGTYTPGLYAETPRFTMKARPRDNKVDESPGPGSHGGHFSTLGDYKPAVTPKDRQGPTPRGGAGASHGRKPTITPS